MRLLKLPTLLLAATLAAGCAQDSPTALDPAGQDAQFSRGTAAKMVPFRADYAAPVGLGPIQPSICPTAFGDRTSGGGQATHLGRFTGTTFSCVDLGTLQVTDGRFTFVGADGSEVTGSYSLSGTPLSPTLIRLNGPFTITGGARRFAGASGGGTITGQADLAAGTLELRFDGGISSVGSMR